jgi:hypothetical protein
VRGASSVRLLASELHRWSPEGLVKGMDSADVIAISLPDYMSFPRIRDPTNQLDSKLES